MSIEPIILETEHHSNGNKKHEKSIVEVDGEQLVLTIYWYENGVKSYESLYHPPLESGDYDDSYIISETSWREDGQIKEEYTLNKPHKAEYDIGDTVSYRKYYDYYDNGQTQKLGEYINGDGNVGKWTYYYESGAVFAIVVHGFGFNNIEQTLYYESGEIKGKGKLDWSGQKEGAWVFYYKNGQIKSKGDYFVGEKDGPWDEFDENGKKIN